MHLLLGQNEKKSFSMTVHRIEMGTNPFLITRSQLVFINLSLSFCKITVSVQMCRVWYVSSWHLIRMTVQYIDLSTQKSSLLVLPYLINVSMCLP